MNIKETKTGTNLIYNEKERVKYITAHQLLNIISHWKNYKGLEMFIMLNKQNGKLHTVRL